MKCRLLFLIVCILSICGCAKTYHIERYNGDFYTFESYKYGDQDFYYKVSFYEDGSVKEESVGFTRKISPVLSEVGNVAKSALAGAKETL